MNIPMGNIGIAHFEIPLPNAHRSDDLVIFHNIQGPIRKTKMPIIIIGLKILEPHISLFCKHDCSRNGTILITRNDPA